MYRKKKRPENSWTFLPRLFAVLLYKRYKVTSNEKIYLALLTASFYYYSTQIIKVFVFLFINKFLCFSWRLLHSSSARHFDDTSNNCSIRTEKSEWCNTLSKRSFGVGARSKRRKCNNFDCCTWCWSIEWSSDIDVGMCKSAHTYSTFHWIMKGEPCGGHSSIQNHLAPSRGIFPK